MADYYPLLAKAVAGLPDPTPDARSAIYDRARNALLGQLRRLEPPIPEAEIDRESAALEIAVARLETEFAPPPEPEAIAPALPAADVAAPSEPSEAAPVSPPSGLEAAPATEDASPQEALPVAETPQSPASSGFIAPPPSDAAASEASPEPPQTTAPSSTLAAPRPPMFFKVRRDKPPFFPPAARLEGFSARRTAGPASALRSPAFPVPPSKTDTAPGEPPEAPAQTRAPADGAPAAPRFPEIERDDFEPRRSDDRDFQPPKSSDGGASDAAAFYENGAGAFEPVGDDESGVAPERPGARQLPSALAKPRADTQRPFAPQPPRESAAPPRLWIFGFILGLLVFLIAIAAYELKDRPEDLRQKAAAPVISPEASSNGKIVDRIGVGSQSPAGAPASSSTRAAADASATKDQGPSPDATAPVSRRAALLVEAPDEQSKVKTYLGAVVWKVDNVSNGPGDPLSMAVHAEIDIPEEKLQAEMTLQKNFDSSLPASHTMKIQFTEPADSPLGGVQQISVPQMRREDTATGDALSGVPVAITDNSFLVGLNRGPSEATNLDLLKSRGWIDVPMLLSNGKIAKLTFEKGPAGERAIDDALAAWSAQ
ncbi:hypothetical protein [Methylocella tundrae]|uniref:Uncharacterized protein n=1 Tax=Methylocella tundrae TaxID=227605 RepID=A0A4U8YWR3_METTU|nr:hypothetical protein [Methylocella tundrae]WPP05348.1 hypothetical protein SIN04_05840 [Methylocella tundrae]VFU07717.1 conserved protein of unknown function [Methylocella tundrae]